MKLFNILLFFLGTYCSTSAQIVNIPDTAFKTFLLTETNIDTNGDNEIQLTEAQAVGFLQVTNPTIRSLEGIRSFSNMTDLAINCPSLMSLDLNDMGITSLYIQADSLSFLNIQGCNSLYDLELLNNNLDELYLSHLPGLRGVHLAFSNTLRALHAENSPSLQTIYSFGTKIDSVLLNDCPSLVSINIAGDFIDVNVSNCTALNNIRMTAGKLENFRAPGCTSLLWMRFDETNWYPDRLAIFDVTGNISLTNISLSMFSTPALDFSSCLNLRHLEIRNNIPGNYIIQLKNGSILSSFQLENYSNDVQYRVCADDFEIPVIQSLLAANPNTALSVTIDDHCTTFPGGNYNAIRGKIQADLDNNGCTSTDPGIGLIPVSITNNSTGSNTIRYTNATGAYGHYIHAGNYTVTPYFAYPYFSIAPISQNIVFDTANHLIDTADFCVTPTATINNLEVTFLPTNRPARPGFDADYRLLYRNRGTTTLSGNVQLSFDQTRMNLVSSTITPTTSLPGQLSWTFNNLRPFESAISDMVFNLLPPPVNNVGDTIIFLAAVNPVVGDNSPSDNSFILPQTIQGSFDPNDKQCLQGGQIDISKIGNDLYYLIRFQNKGTDTAFNVIVADTLTNHYNEETFDIVTASHPVNVKRTANKIEFLFQDIKLPHEAINEPASHGYIVYKVKPVNSLVIGDSLNNKASIYFDYNLPIVTNKATTIVSSLGPVPVRVEYFTGARKGMVNDLYWKAACSGNNSRFGIERSADGTRFESIGILSATDNRCLMPFSFTDASPLKGTNYYRLKITDENGLVHYSKTILLQNSGTVTEIISVWNSGINIHVSVYSQHSQEMSLQLYSSDGKLICHQKIAIQKGHQILTIPTPGISSGVYQLLLSGKNEPQIGKRYLHLH